MRTEGSRVEEITIVFTPATPKLREVLDEILREQAEGTAPAALAGPLSGYYTQRGQLAVLLGILKTAESLRPSPVLHPGVQRARQYLQEHFRDKVSLTVVAARSHLSRSRLTHLFTQQTGQSMTTYLATLRIAHAKALLGQEGRSIAKVGEEVGFGDAGHFAKVFRRLEGRSPSRYRQKKPKPPKE